MFVTRVRLYYRHIQYISCQATTKVPCRGRRKYLVGGTFRPKFTSVLCSLGSFAHIKSIFSHSLLSFSFDIFDEWSCFVEHLGLGPNIVSEKIWPLLTSGYLAFNMSIWSLQFVRSNHVRVSGLESLTFRRLNSQTLHTFGTISL